MMMKKRFGVVFVDDAFIEGYLRATLSNRECVQKTLAAVNRAKVKVDLEQFCTLAHLALDGEFAELHHRLEYLEQQPLLSSGAALSKSDVTEAFKRLDMNDAQTEKVNVRFKKALDQMQQVQQCPNSLVCSLVMNQNMGSGQSLQQLQDCIQDISTFADEKDLPWRFPPPVLSKLELTTEKSEEERIVGLAYDLALLGDSSCLYGAVLADSDGQVISAGYNHRYVVRGGNANKRKIIHAEVHALVQCTGEEKIVDGVMYVVQVERRGAHFLNSTPCVMCTSALSKRGVRLCRYSRTEGPPGRLKISRNMSVDTGSLDMAKRSDTFAKVNLDSLLRKHALESTGKVEPSP